MVKSPSDTTIYAPALTKQNSMHQIIQALNQNPNIDEPFNHEIVHNQVSNFVGAVRKQVEERQAGHGQLAPTTSVQATPRPVVGRVITPDEEVRLISQKAVIDAERHRADVTIPPAGMVIDQNYVLSDQMGNLNVSGQTEQNMSNPLAIGQPMVSHQQNSMSMPITGIHNNVVSMTQQQIPNICKG